jgi:hypothetical protein
MNARVEPQEVLTDSVRKSHSTRRFSAKITQAVTALLKSSNGARRQQQRKTQAAGILGFATPEQGLKC